MSPTVIPGGASTCEPHPDRHRQVVAQRERQRAALGGQRVGAAGVDDRHRVEEVVDGVAASSSAAAGPARCGRRAAPTGSARAACPRAAARCTALPVRPVRSSVGQRRGQTPQPAGGGRDAGGHRVVEASTRIAERIGGQRPDVLPAAPRSLSAITAVNGRGAARPARMEVATADRIDCGVVGAEAPRPAAASGSGCAVRPAARRPRHSTEASASCRRATAESC